MDKKDKVIVIDLDGTLCYTKEKSENYSEVRPNIDVINKLIEYRKKGYYIIIYTSRNMNTYNNNLGLINKNTAKIIFEWLEKFKIPYDEIYFGKPWCGFKGFYIDDKAIRPNEFLEFTEEEINNLILTKNKK